MGNEVKPKGQPMGWDKPDVTVQAELPEQMQDADPFPTAVDHPALPAICQAAE